MDSDGASILSWPSLSSSCSSLIVLIVLIRIGYTMGTNARDDKKNPVSSWWWGCFACVMLMATWAVIKFVD